MAGKSAGSGYTTTRYTRQNGAGDGARPAQEWGPESAAQMTPAFVLAMQAVQELGAQLDDEVPGIRALVDRIAAAERAGNTAEAWRLAAILFAAVSVGDIPVR
jgi:hypothetical protein